MQSIDKMIESLPEDARKYIDITLKRGYKKLKGINLTEIEMIYYMVQMQYTPSGAYAGYTGVYDMEHLYQGIDFKPPVEVAKEAALSLDYRFNKNIKAGMDIGIGRAVQLAQRFPVPPRDIRRMRAYFSRHGKDLSSERALSGEITPGIVSWLLWGGDSGKNWCDSIFDQMVKAEQSFRK